MNRTPAQIFDIRGQTVLVTGASSGLGRHFATTLAAAGARIAVAARRAARLDALVAALRAQGAEARAYALDVTRRDSVTACLDGVVADFGGLDTVVNNAGISDTKRPLDYTDADWQAIIGTNLTGAWTVAQEAARRMVVSGQSGNIINITSILANRVGGGVGPYSVAKAGLAHLTRSLALELARHHIRVNAIAPGYVVTEINQDVLTGPQGDALRLRIPSRAFNRFDDLDGALLLLASPASRGMTGAEIVVDGGHSVSTL